MSTMQVASSARKYLRRSANMFRYEILLNTNDIISPVRFPSVVRCHMRNVKRAMRTNARRLQDKLPTRLQDTDVCGPREHSLMTKDVENIVICVFHFVNNLSIHFHLSA